MQPGQTDTLLSVKDIHVFYGESHIIRGVSLSIHQGELLNLLGRNGVGKTTLLLQYLKKYFKVQEFLYFSADDVYITDTKLYDIADEFSRLGGKVLAIDEIHRYNNWAQEIKNIYDSFPELIIRFSGSSMLSLLYEKYD